MDLSHELTLICELVLLVFQIIANQKIRNLDTKLRMTANENDRMLHKIVRKICDTRSGDC